MSKKEEMYGVKTTFNDNDGTPIKIHDYVKDADGNRYYINSACQAVPDGSEAPAVELGSLIEKGPVYVMSIEEVLNMNHQETRRRRGGRRSKPAAEEPRQEEKKPEEKKPEAGSDAQGAVPGEPLSPVNETMVLSVIPDDALANELRRRGYYLTAVKPALISL